MLAKFYSSIKFLISRCLLKAMLVKQKKKEALSLIFAVSWSFIWGFIQGFLNQLSYAVSNIESPLKGFFWQLSHLIYLKLGTGFSAYFFSLALLLSSCHQMTSLCIQNDIVLKKRNRKFDWSNRRQLFFHYHKFKFMLTKKELSPFWPIKLTVPLL